MKLLLIFSLFAIYYLHADDIYLKSGFVIKNVKVIDSTLSKVNIIKDGKPSTISLDIIDNIFIGEYDSTQAAKYEWIRQDEIIEPFKKKESTANVFAKKQYEYPNMNLLPLSIVCFALGWDFLASAKDYSDAIEELNKYNIINTELKSDKNRKTIVGVLLVSAGIANTIISFQSVEVKVSLNSVTLNYNF